MIFALVNQNAFKLAKNLGNLLTPLLLIAVTEYVIKLVQTNTS